ncbi:multiple antibiotic resistance [Shigella flexneri 5 str. 8401]|uniref:Multiple antibiotic resistance protein MarA n=1 Tax=Shigella flexneri serotype 5b (strain 8401) TaxID=373384 RepID=Q0T4J8_SHIF8|nr:multiple antibiotic resistance [Shigella flexneri 5 str. 8401]ADA73959.1 Multiple antibiotic resistance protein marA [Shigella flexneri 2002017]
MQHLSICLRKSCRKQKRGMTMSRRNTDAITIHSILDWIEDNLESPLSLEKVSERSGYSKWHLQRMFKKETGHSLGQYIRSRKMTEIAQKLKESNEPILYLAERYGFESQQTLTRTFKNYFDVPPHKYRMTNMQGESRFLHPLNHYNS